MELNTQYLYTIVYFSSMIGMTVFIGIMLAFIKIVVDIFRNLMTSIFGKEDIKVYD